MQYPQDRRGFGWRSMVAAGAAVALLSTAAGATAATLITGADVKNGSLTGADIKNSSLTGTDIKNSSLTGADIANNGIARADLAPAVRGSLLGGRIPSGTRVTGTYYFDVASTVGNDYAFTVQLPGKAGIPLTPDNVNFAPDSSPTTIDDDARCPADFADPNAPAGVVCIYPGGMTGDTENLNAFGMDDSTFAINWSDSATGPDAYVYVTWTYTAP